MSKRSTISMKEKLLGGAGSKQKVNSKVKGNRNELEVAKALTRWTGVEFRRTPMSGAIHVPLDWLCGDVFCVDKNFDFPFSVETKHYRKVTNSLLHKWWDQTCDDAKRINKLPLLIYRSNNWPADTWDILLPISRFVATRAGLPSNSFGYDLKVSNVHSTYLFNIDYYKFIKWLT